MAKQTPGLLKSFAADSAIASANVCVVMSAANPGNITLPAALAAKFVGIAAEPTPGGSVTNQIAVQLSGIAQVQSDGSAAISAGDYLVIGNASGQVKSVTPTSGTSVREIIGIAISSAGANAGALVDVLIQPMVYLGA